MKGEREAQEPRNGIHLAPSFPPHWPALLARERYLRLKIRAVALSLLPPEATRWDEPQRTQRAQRSQFRISLSAIFAIFAVKISSIQKPLPKVALHRRGSTPMRGEREAQELRNGIHLDSPFPPHWHALLARERYLKLKILSATDVNGTPPAGAVRARPPHPAIFRSRAGDLEAGELLCAEGRGEDILQVVAGEGHVAAEGLDGPRSR